MLKFKWFNTTFMAVVVSTVAVTASTQSFAKQYYKWVDSKGSTHYTSTPPPKNARVKKVETYGYRGELTTAPTPTVAQPTTTPATTNTTSGQNHQNAVPVVQQQIAPPSDAK